MRRKSRDSSNVAEYRGGKVLQRWRGSGGNVRLSHLLMSFLFKAVLTVNISVDDFMRLSLTVLK